MVGSSSPNFALNKLFYTSVSYQLEINQTAVVQGEITNHDLRFPKPSTRTSCLLLVSECLVVLDFLCFFAALYYSEMSISQAVVITKLITHCLHCT